MIYSIICGAIAGWASGNLMRGKGFGFLGNIVVGIVGGMLGGWFLVGKGVVGQLVTATLGACLLIFLVDKIRGKD